MTQERKHSPLPWKTRGRFIRNERAFVCECEGKSAAYADDERSMENAAFIVLACNNHYKLVVAMREALKLLEKGAPGWGVSKDLLRKALAEAEAK